MRNAAFIDFSAAENYIIEADTMSLQNIEYVFPSAAYLILIIILFLVLFWSLYQYRLNKLAAFASPEVLEKMRTPRSNFVFWNKTAAFCVAWILLTIALMQPIGYGHYPKQPEAKPSSLTGQGKQRKPHDVILLIDASASMNVTDMRNNRNRLDSAKEIADAIISRLDGQSTALNAFTSETIKLAPITTDYLFVRLVLRELKINEGGTSGTDLQTALSDMRHTYFSEPTETLKTLILLTDGGDTEMESLSGEAWQSRINAILDPIKDAANNHLRVFTIGLGTKQGGTVPGVADAGKPVTAILEEDVLRQISQTGMGEYYYANDFSALDLAAKLVTTLKSEETYIQKNAENKSSNILQGTIDDNLVHALYYQIPLGIAIILLAGVLLLPDVTRHATIDKRFEAL